MLYQIVQFLNSRRAINTIINKPSRIQSIYLPALVLITRTNIWIITHRLSDTLSFHLPNIVVTAIEGTAAADQAGGGQIQPDGSYRLQEVVGHADDQHQRIQPLPELHALCLGTDPALPLGHAFADVIRSGLSCTAKSYTFWYNGGDYE